MVRPLGLLNVLEQRPPADLKLRLVSIVSRGLAGPCLLILCLSACERGGVSSGTVNIVPAPPQTTEVQEYRSPPDPACSVDQEGMFRTGGNRWQRDGRLCIDQVVLSFDAFPDPSVGYTIQSDRCPEVRHFSRFRRPANFFERLVPEQIGLLRAAISDDLREFSRQCRIQLDPTAFVDDRLDQFYLDFGDGWWFGRIDGGIRLTPNVRSGAAPEPSR